jgi:hypothetical protein
MKFFTDLPFHHFISAFRHESQNIENNIVIYRTLFIVSEMIYLFYVKRLMLIY